MADSNDAFMSKVPTAKLNDIVFTEIIKGGTFGSVYRAKWLDYNDVLVQTVPIEERKYFDIQVKQLLHMKHPNIIRLLGTASDLNSNYIILEYADGGCLDKFLHVDFQEEYTRSQALSWAQQCAEGVAYLHSNYVLHRDLRPVNLLLTNSRSLLKICDFDEIVILKDKYISDGGKVAYMAPEVSFSYSQSIHPIHLQVPAGVNVTEKADVYSWAIVLWETLRREKPFKDFKNRNILYAVESGSRPPISELWPDSIKNLLNVCWSHNPNDRPWMPEVANLMREVLKREEVAESKSVPVIDINKIIYKEVIHHGRYGTVFKAEIDDGPVAVKKFFIDYDVKLFDLEVNQQSQLNHSSLIRILGRASDFEFRCIIMEYADGGSLHSFLHSDSKPEYSRQAGIRWALQCAEGLAYLHELKPKPLILPSLTPHNLLLTNNYNQLKICNLFNIPETEKEIIGNRDFFRYMAPEVFTGSSCNEKNNVYSWSIVFWEILTREKPFKIYDNNFLIINKIEEGERPPLNNELPKWISTLLTDCWSTEPIKRPTMSKIVSTNILRRC